MLCSSVLCEFLRTSAANRARYSKQLVNAVRKIAPLREQARNRIINQ